MGKQRKEEPKLAVQVINVRHLRSGPYMGKPIYVGRTAGTWTGSPLGNPYKLGHGASDAERIDVIEQYQKWLSGKLYEQFLARSVVRSCEHVNEQAEAFEGLCERLMINSSITLGCWCTPKLCHAHVLQYEIMRRCGSPWDENIDRTPWALHLASKAAPVPVLEAANSLPVGQLSLW